MECSNNKEMPIIMKKQIWKIFKVEQNVCVGPSVIHCQLCQRKNIKIYKNKSNNLKYHCISVYIKLRTCHCN